MDTAGAWFRVAADEKIMLGVDVAALTAGKVHFYFQVNAEA